MPRDAPLPEWITRVGVFDLETTGVDVEHDRIVTAHIGLLDARGVEIAARNWMADPGIPIPDGATAVHGITTAHAQTHGRPALEVVTQVSSALASLLSQGVPIVAYNASYDFSLLAHEARRHGIPALKNPSPVIDPLVIDKAYDRYRPGKRTLQVVAAHYAVPLEDAHDASADAVAAGRIAQALARQFVLPVTLSELHERQIGWARSQAASLTDYFIRIGRIDPEDTIDGSWPVRPRRAPLREDLPRAFPHP
ncbi:DNA polymerase III subunit epsilon [Microbacterium sp. SZ1]|uniref:3'-5' exonuclease n=1 Tax=Microbacterium sp. SZ1 TaxID=1849736 RepID=UPI000BBCAE90|nr:3'-5' exonuclease [Microbacterium sp. SZ1]PCE13832.1 DNA polymerase III subunit epsilon [Microbacterium sp. SZ1]